ncbi:unnamed protein product [Ilex paraguariensis]|uniref:Uncharacterized protein n=1 Tax=Ilex paraguariensis TaxID=185542 RepID=A0ABC8SZX1_9AQUA
MKATRRTMKRGTMGGSTGETIVGSPVLVATSGSWLTSGNGQNADSDALSNECRVMGFSREKVHDAFQLRQSYSPLDSFIIFAPLPF